MSQQSLYIEETVQFQLCHVLDMQFYRIAQTKTIHTTKKKYFK